jgi:hypothetical protein
VTGHEALTDLVGFYFLWQQNQIFRRQNDIFASAQSGSVQMATNNPVRRWLKRYWPIVAMAILALIVWGPSGYKYYGLFFGSADAGNKEASDPWAPWVFGVGIVSLVGLDVRSRFKEKALKGAPAVGPSEQSIQPEALAAIKQQWQAEFEQQWNAKQKLAAALSAEDVLLNGLSETEYKLYIAVRGDFTNLPWAQKITLKRVCSAGRFDIDGIKGGLAADGFEHPEWIVQELIRKRFLESGDGKLSVPIAKAKWIEVLFEGIKLC